jgi:hypothetical protein
LIGCEIKEDEFEKINIPVPNKQTEIKQQNRIITTIKMMIGMLDDGFCLIGISDSIAKN